MNKYQDKALELLPGIEEFLTKILAEENLSEAAEKKRQYYSERLDVLKLAFPPTLPPRNEGDDYIAQQRELARLRGTLPPPSEFEDGKDYDPVDTTTTSNTNSTPIATMEDDLLYEEPVDLTDNTTSAPFEDVFSDTSYESYEDEDESSGLYINQDFHDDPNLVLPSNKKKKKKVDKGGTPARCLLNVTFSGEMYNKVKWSWSKRYCLIKDGKFMCFKSENATKPVHEFVLDGYDILYLEKEAKRNHVIRVSRPGAETLFYSAESKEKVDQWLEVLTMASCGGSGGSVTTSGFSSAASSSPKIDKDGDTQTATHTDAGVRKSSSLTDLSMTSEGSSGDGTIGQPKNTDADKKGAKTDRKGGKPIFDSLSTFFGTLSKKKGEKIQKQRPSDVEENMDPEANVCGYLSVYSDLMTSKKWNRRWCVVKQNILTIFKDIGEDAEFSLPLRGCEVVSACDPKRKMAMRIMEEGLEKIILDMPDTVAQGQWLNVLIRETGCAEGKGRFPANNGYGAEEEDIYCDVDDDQDLLESWNLPKEWSLTSDSSTVSEATTRPSEKEAEETKKPPPLPSAPPPGVTLAKVGTAPSYGGQAEFYPESEELYENADAIRNQLHNDSLVESYTDDIYENTPGMGIESEYLNPPGSEMDYVSDEIYDDIGEVDYIELPDNGSNLDDSTKKHGFTEKVQVSPQISDPAPQPTNQRGPPPLPTGLKDRAPQQTNQRGPPPLPTGMGIESEYLNPPDSEVDYVSDEIYDDTTHQVSNQRGLPSLPTNQEESPHQVTNQKDLASQRTNQNDTPPQPANQRDPEMIIQRKLSSGSEDNWDTLYDSEESEECFEAPSESMSEEQDISEQETIEQELNEQKRKPRGKNYVAMKILELEKSSDSEYLKKEQPKQNRATRRTSIKRPTEAPPSIPVLKKDESEDKEVVKCHQGRTIEEDRDILEATKNPILSQLRKKSRSGSEICKSPTPSSGTLSSPKTKAMTSGTVEAMELDKVEESIDDTKRKLAIIKKKRAEIRSKKLGCADIDEKLRLDDKLRDLLRDQDNSEADLAKLSLRQAELQAQQRKARLEQESQARKESLSRIERQGSFSRLDKKDSFSRFESGEWDLITKKGIGSEDEGSRKSGTSTPRSNGSSPSTGRKANSLDRGTGPRTVTMNTKNGVGGPSGTRSRNTRYTSDLTGRTTRTMAVSRTASMSSAMRPDSPRGLRLSSRTEEEDRSPSPRGGRKQVQEKLKLWENISGSSNC